MRVHKKDNQRIMQENIALIKEINELRREIKNMKDRQRAREEKVLLRRKKKSAESASTGRRQEIEVSMEMQQEQIRALKAQLGALSKDQNMDLQDFSRYFIFLFFFFAPLVSLLFWVVSLIISSIYTAGRSLVICLLCSIKKDICTNRLNPHHMDANVGKLEKFKTVLVNLGLHPTAPITEENNARALIILLSYTYN